MSWCLKGLKDGFEDTYFEGFARDGAFLMTPHQRYAVRYSKEDSARHFAQAFRMRLVRLKPGTLTKAERAELAAGRPIIAVKMLRDRTQCGLKEAKDLVEATPEYAAWRSTLYPPRDPGPICNVRDEELAAPTPDRTESDT